VGSTAVQFQTDSPRDPITVTTSPAVTVGLSNIWVTAQPGT
jgi:hypothetical protein